MLWYTLSVRPPSSQSQASFAVLLVPSSILPPLSLVRNESMNTSASPQRALVLDLPRSARVLAPVSKWRERMILVRPPTTFGQSDRSHGHRQPISSATSSRLQRCLLIPGGGRRMLRRCSARCCRSWSLEWAELLGRTSSPR